MPDSKLNDIDRRGFCLITAAALGSLLNGGCGGGSGGSSGGGAAGSAPATKLQPNVVVLPSDGSVTVSGVSPTSLTLSGTHPNITTGVVIVDPVAPGLIRKVTSSSPSSSGTTLQTTQGTLEDVFKQVHIELTTQLGPGDLAQSSPGRYDITARNPERASIGKVFPIDFVNIPLAPGATFSLSGSLSVTLDIGLDIGFSGFFPIPAIQHAHVVASLNITLQAQLAVEEGISIDKTVQLGPTFDFGPIPLCDTPPIWVTPSLSMFTVASGDLKVGIAVTGKIGGTASAGVQFSQVTGWQAVKSAVPTTKLQPTTDEYTDLTFSLVPLRVKMDFDLEDVLGPYIYLDLSTLDLTVTRITDPAGTEVLLTDQFDANAGFHVEALGRTLADASFPGLVLFQGTILKQVFLDQGQVNLGIS